MMVFGYGSSNVTGYLIAGRLQVEEQWLPSSINRDGTIIKVDYFQAFEAYVLGMSM